MPTDKLEQELFMLLKRISTHSILTSSQLIRFCSLDNSSIVKWIDKVFKLAQDSLVKENIVTLTRRKKGNYVYCKATDKAGKLAEQLLGLKYFFLDYTLLEKRRPIEVKLWDYYLMYAMILGVAKEVENQFRNLYPEDLEHG